MWMGFHYLSALLAEIHQTPLSSVIASFES
jgi:hypothetical protein